MSLFCSGKELQQLLCYSWAKPTGKSLHSHTGFNWAVAFRFCPSEKHFSAPGLLVALYLQVTVWCDGKAAKGDFQYLNKRNQWLNIVLKIHSGMCSIYHTLKCNPVCWLFIFLILYHTCSVCKGAECWHLQWSYRRSYARDFPKSTISSPCYEGHLKSICSECTEQFLDQKETVGFAASTVKPASFHSFLQVWTSSPESSCWKCLSQSLLQWDL